MGLIAPFTLGMELFEEALRKWEQALNIRLPTQSTSSSNSLALQGATCGDFPMVTTKQSLPAHSLILLCLVGFISNPNTVQCFIVQLV